MRYSTQVQQYLNGQKKRLLNMDGASIETGWLTEREVKGTDYVIADVEVGRKKGMMEILYDNTINWILQNQDSMRMRLDAREIAEALQEDTTTTNIATFTTALLPAVRRIYANLIAMDLVSVQPLKGPSGYVYWMDHHFTDDFAQDGISAGDRVDENQDIDEYTDSSEKGTIHELEFKLTKKLIETESKKVKMDWTLESEQDLKAQWGYDLEGELIPMLTDQIVREINRKIINALYAGAGAGNVTWDPNPPAGDTTTADKAAYYQTLYHAIAEANSAIFQAKYINANWLLMNGNTYYYFQRLENFNADPHAVNQMSNMSVNFIGTLNGIYKVYIDPFFTDDVILMGIRPNDWKYASGYYSPYIPLYISDKYIASGDFTQFVKGAMSRYAYGVIPESSTQNPVQNTGLATITISSS